MNPVNRPNMQVVQRVASAMRDEDLNGWRAEVERFAVSIGSRETLCHVSDRRWEWHFLAGEEPADAVLGELALVDG